MSDDLEDSSAGSAHLRPHPPRAHPQPATPPTGTRRASIGRAPADNADAAAIARDWLIGAGQRPEPGRIAALLPHVRHLQAAHRRTAIALLRDGQAPTAAAVATHHQTQITRERARTRGEAARGAADIDVALELAPRTAAWVADYRATHGHGPTLGEVAAAGLLPPLRIARGPAVRALARAGWLTGTDRTRGLAPGPLHQTRLATGAVPDDAVATP